MSEIKCRICGSVDDPEWYRNDTRDQMVQDQICFSCNFWSNQLIADKEVRGEHGWAVIDGTHYAILPDDPKAYFKGHGGHEFKIRFLDGTEIVTHNLWCQGNIPPSWKDKFPDNAVFILT